MILGEEVCKSPPSFPPSLPRSCLLFPRLPPLSSGPDRAQRGQHHPHLRAQGVESRPQTGLEMPGTGGEGGKRGRSLQAVGRVGNRSQTCHFLWIISAPSAPLFLPRAFYPSTLFSILTPPPPSTPPFLSPSGFQWQAWQGSCAGSPLHVLESYLSYDPTALPPSRPPPRPLHMEPPGVTVHLPVEGEKFNLAKSLQFSMLFYEAQRSGRMPRSWFPSLPFHRPARDFDPPFPS